MPVRRGSVRVFRADESEPVALGQAVVTSRLRDGCELLSGSVTISRWLTDERSTAIGGQHRLELDDGVTVVVVWTEHFPDSCGQEILRFTGERRP